MIIAIRVFVFYEMVRVILNIIPWLNLYNIFRCITYSMLSPMIWHLDVSRQSNYSNRIIKLKDVG